VYSLEEKRTKFALGLAYVHEMYALGWPIHGDVLGPEDVLDVP
jgi:hypothetical protein